MFGISLLDLLVSDLNDNTIGNGSQANTYTSSLWGV